MESGRGVPSGDKLCATMYQHPGFSGNAPALAGPGGVQMGHGYSVDFGYIVYRDKTWRGSLRGFEVNEYSFDDQFSSIRVEAGCSLWAWEHPSEQGTMWHISEGNHEFPQPWNDVISSAKCSCEAKPGRVPDHVEPFTPPVVPAGLPGWTIPY